MRFTKLRQDLNRNLADCRFHRRLQRTGLFSSTDLLRFSKDTQRFWNDYHFLREIGLFVDAMYSRRYLNGIDPEVALPHYILVGESLGYRPNPFFDPCFFERRSGTRRFVDYLSHIPLWSYAISEYFDSPWYIERYSAELATAENPLRHFWHKGFDKSFNPSPRFDMTFFRRALARDHIDKKGFACTYLFDSNRATPLNIGELEARQADFYRSIRFEVLKSAEAPRRPFLVFVQSGRDFIPAYHYETATFDTLVNYYDASTRIGDGVQYIFRQSGTKTTAVAKLLERCPDLLLGYQAVLLLDDDVVISQDQIETLFRAREKHGIDLLQASLTADSECYFPPLKQPEAGSGLRLISAVEIMMPLLSRRALQACGWVFRESVSGWGADLLLSAAVRGRFGDTVAVLGDVVCAHRRAVEPADGALYQFLRQSGIEATTESGKIAIKYDLNDKMSAVHYLDRSVLEWHRRNPSPSQTNKVEHLHRG